MPRRTSFILFVALAVLLAVGWTAAQQQPGIDLERIERSTVFIMQAQNVGNNLVVTCVGSGTLVSRDGLILTNAHNTVTSSACPGDTLVIALSVRVDEPPIPRYRAEVVQSDPGVDLALLRITRQSDGRLLDSSSLALPFVELADSTAVPLDETITVIGYPGIGNDPVTSIRGTVSGFVAEPRGGDRAWMKTSAAIPGVVSGGGAYDEQGLLVGIPTTAPVTSETAGASCSPVWDTNGDGIVNNSDVCIPIGGFINSMRPSEFARPLLRAASLGLSLQVQGSNRRLASGGNPAFSNLFFSTSVNEAGMPTTVVRNLPAGATSLYLFFDYANMTPETVYELRVTTDGIPNATFSLAPVRWSGGERGLWYIGSSGQPWPNGVYEFTLFANGVAADTARLTIGASPDNSPTFGNPVFGLVDARGELFGEGYVVPVGGTAYARFTYNNIQSGTRWTAIWYFEGQEVYRTPRDTTWAAEDGTNGSKVIQIQPVGGLQPGSYRLALYVEDRLAALSEFTVAGAQQGALPQVFNNTRFVSAQSAEEARNAVPVTTFTTGLNTLYLLFDWQQMAPGTLWTMVWSVDNDEFYRQVVPWNEAASGQAFLVQIVGAKGIPDGTYHMDLYVNNIKIATIEARVGIGQLPIDQFSQASGVQMRGQILDAETRRGIPDVTFVLLSPQFSVSDFKWDASQIYALAISDRNGNFEVDRPLQYDAPYSVVIAAQGYLPISSDGVKVTTSSPNPLNMTIYLTHD
jgi:S1-C subfamily serine protease